MESGPYRPQKSDNLHKEKNDHAVKLKSFNRLPPNQILTDLLSTIQTFVDFLKLNFGFKIISPNSALPGYQKRTSAADLGVDLDADMLHILFPEMFGTANGRK